MKLMVMMEASDTDFIKKSSWHLYEPVGARRNNFKKGRSNSHFGFKVKSILKIKDIFGNYQSLQIFGSMR